ncbi:MAG: nickel-dependent lactate racemase, partial [Actinobacteria bacterium]|nr:nickel-dependent lactate racemase [Actinomycetota bacterium]
GYRVAGVYTPNPAPPAPDPERAIRSALAQPVGAPRLRDAARGKRTALILVDDITRATPADRIVPALLEELAAGGLSHEAVTVMIALGTHRPMTPVEVERKLGAHVVRDVAVIQHDHTIAPLRDLGVTPNGTPIAVNRRLFDVDLVIGTGTVVPHHIPGYSGGAKIVQPGVSGAATTAATHMFSARAEQFLLGQVDNPVRAEMERIAEQSGLDFVLNVTLNDVGRLVSAHCGGTRPAFRRAVRDANAIYGVAAQHGLDVVVAGSHPCDIEFWQAHKSLYPAAMIVRPGGTIVLVTPCPEGVAVMHPDVLDYAAQPSGTIAAAYDRGAIADAVGASLAVAWARVREYANVTIVSDGIGREDARALGFTKAADVTEALARALPGLTTEPALGVLTHAPDTLPMRA